MIERATELRGQLKLMCDANAFDTSICKPIRTPDGRVRALRMTNVHDFRCLLLALKEDLGLKGGGNNVLLRNAVGYDGCILLAGKDDGRATVGVTEAGTIISVAKGGAKSPKDADQHRMPDLMYTAVKEFGGDHLACLAHLVPFYSRFGFDVEGIVPIPPEKSTPGWTEVDSQANAKLLDAWKFNGPEGEVKLPLVIMRVNPQRFAEFEAKLLATGNMLPATPGLDSSVFDSEQVKSNIFGSAVEAYDACSAKRAMERAEADTKPVAA